MGKMTRAIKDHTCTLCHTPIEEGTEYIYKTITPWHHIDNETFGVYKAHEHCDMQWKNGAGLYADWVFPTDGVDWAEILIEVVNGE
jgi:hypothetical protein